MKGLVSLGFHIIWSSCRKWILCLDCGWDRGLSGKHPKELTKPAALHGSNLNCCLRTWNLHSASILSRRWKGKERERRKEGGKQSWQGLWAFHVLTSHGLKCKFLSSIGMGLQSKRRSVIEKNCHFSLTSKYMNFGLDYILHVSGLSSFFFFFFF